MSPQERKRRRHSFAAYMASGATVSYDDWLAAQEDRARAHQDIGGPSMAALVLIVLACIGLTVGVLAVAVWR